MGLQEDMPQTIPGNTLIKQLVTYSTRRQTSFKAPKNRFPNAKGQAHKSSESNWNYAKKPSIAAASIIGAITFFAIVFLIVWYIRRRRQRKRLDLQLQDMENQLQDTFNQSSLTLNEVVNQSLDDFLRKDIEPERTSLMFSRSRSPSLSFIVDENDRQRSPSSRLYRTSYEASSDTLGKLTRVSTEESKASTVLSLPDLTRAISCGSSSTQVLAMPLPSRLSSASIIAPTVRSSTWTTTSASTIMASTGTDITPRDSAYGLHGLPGERNVRVRSMSRREIRNSLSPASSIIRAHPSNASRASSRISVASHRYSAPRAIQQSEGSRRVRAKSNRESTSTIESPVDSAWSASGRSSELPSIMSTSSNQSPLFRFSEG